MIYPMPPLFLYLFLAIIFIWLLALTYFLLRPEKQAAPIVSQASIGGWKFSLIRYNPFSDTGGEQSFVLSLLNPSGSGILITSLHSRDKTRLYAKEVKNGKAETELSAEEKQALDKSLNS